MKKNNKESKQIMHMTDNSKHKQHKQINNNIIISQKDEAKTICMFYHLF